MELKEIKAFVESEAGRAAKEYFLEKRRSLWSIYRLRDITDKDKLTVQVIGMGYANDIIDEILRDIMEVENEKPREPKPEEDSLIPL